MPDPIPTDDLTILRQRIQHPVDHVETFPAPPACALVRLRSDEVTSVCPVTGQPDLATVEIEYQPAGRCIESKSLKLYLWRFRDRAVFAEALASEIAEEVMASAAPHHVAVTLTQRPRGGITITATAVLPAGAVQT